MTNQKNRFFTLVFSCCPGAGEMYMGLYRQGVSLMGLFFGTIALAAWLGFEELIFFICPIVWCYSFFHTHNLRRMTEEEFATVEDRFIFADYVNLDRDWKCSPKHRRVFGFVLLLIALSELWKQAMYLMERFFYIPDFAWALSHTIPQIVVAVVILVVALRLMREKIQIQMRKQKKRMSRKSQKPLWKKKTKSCKHSTYKSGGNLKKGFLPFFNTI